MSPPPPSYHQTLADIPIGIERSVFIYLLDHVGKDNRVRLEGISYAILGSESEISCRQIRSIIETLRVVYRVPILADSGTAGRWLAANRQEVREFLAELYSRRKAINDLIFALETSIIPTGGALPAQTRLF